MLSSYPSMYNGEKGHPGISKLWEGSVIVEEKVDGSQFSFSLVNGELIFRSKNQVVNPEAPHMFSNAVKAIEEIKYLLHPNWIYRGEYLSSPKHNTLKYSRVPNRYIIIWDVEIAEQEFLSPIDKQEECKRIGLECVPLFYHGPASVFKETLPEFKKHILNNESILGGQKIEGFVIKNYNQFGQDKKICVGKVVSDAFKEIHLGEWKSKNPSTTDVVYNLGKMFKSDVRWRKAVQHLRDSGELTNSPKDLAKLVPEVKTDIWKEHEQEIKEILLNHFKKEIEKFWVHGLPEWYKEQLLNDSQSEVSDSS